MSCPAVFDIIANNEKSCDVYIYGKEYEPEDALIFKPDTIDDVKSNPGLKYRNQLFDFFHGILSDKKRDIHTSMIRNTCDSNAFKAGNVIAGQNTGGYIRFIKTDKQPGTCKISFRY